MNKSSNSPHLTSFSSLPNDIILNCLARVSSFCRPTLSLVSKSFRSLMTSPDLEAIRSHNGITEDCLYVCLDLNEKNPNPSWFTLCPLPKQQKLKPVPLFPHQHPKSSTVVSIGSEIYIIGGLVNGQRSNSVLSLDGRSHQWSILPNMRQPRVSPAADVIDGKIYVIGGSMSNDIEDWGEVYDPKTQTWEPILPTTLDLTTQKSVLPGRLVMGGKVYAMNGLKHELRTDICLLDNTLVLMSGWFKFFFLDQDLVWRTVDGLEEIDNFPYFSYLDAVAKSSTGKRVTVWWKSVVSRSQDHHCTKECKTKIWCAEISFERRSLEKLWGSVEWIKNVFTFEGCDSRPGFFLHSVIISH